VVRARWRCSIEAEVASVVAAEPTTCLAIAAWDAERLLPAEPELALASSDARGAWQS
jgi:hypothetical protein